MGSKSSGVQGSILIPGLHLGYVFTGKASAFDRPNPEFEPKLVINWKMSIFNEGTRASGF
jgi:hypothetical protein